jgi:hypothetical protein
MSAFVRAPPFCVILSERSESKDLKKTALGCPRTEMASFFEVYLAFLAAVFFFAVAAFFAATLALTFF